MGRDPEGRPGRGSFPRRNAGFPTNPLHDASEVLLDIGKLEPGNVDASFHDHDDISIVRELFTPKAEGFANQTFDPISANRRADFTARGDAQSRPPGGTRRGVRQKKKEEIPGVVFPAFGVTLREFRAYPELIRGPER